MQLSFPPRSGGLFSGLNDAGIETFEGDSPTHIIRECAQNSLDVAHSDEHPVRLEIRKAEFQENQLPFKEELKHAINSCLAFWNSQPKAKEFFSRARDILNSRVLPALIISDYGTKGVSGDDEDITSPWVGLVTSRGVTIKEHADSGGAFGIGKDAPLAASPLRTVLYSTLTTKNEFAFQGVCRLVTHTDKNGQHTQGTGFIGLYDSKFQITRAIRDQLQLDRIFKRTEAGLDIWILGLSFASDDWERPFVISALTNFWPAIQKNKIIFKIGRYDVSQNTIKQLMDLFHEDPSIKDALPYYKSLTDPAGEHRAEHNVPTAGKCSLHVLYGKPGYPQKICMVRKTGMVIDYYRPRVSVVPFAGLFVCEDYNGNNILKSLEPPRHNKFEQSRAKTPEAKRILDDVKSWIRSQLEEILPKINSETLNETNVPKELLDMSSENKSKEDEGKSSEKDLSGIPTTPSKEELISSPTTAPRFSTTFVIGKIGKGKGGATKKGKGKSGKGSGKKEGHGRNGPGRPSSEVPGFEARFFRKSPSDPELTAVIKAGQDYRGSIQIVCVGEDSTASPVQIKRCRDSNGKSVKVSNSVLLDINIPKGTGAKFIIEPASLLATALSAIPILNK